MNHRNECLHFVTVYPFNSKSEGQSERDLYNTVVFFSPVLM